jgi:hypothetical protein
MPRIPDYSFIDMSIVNYLRENIGKKYTVYNLYSLLRKKHPELKYSFPLLYRRIPFIQKTEPRIKTQRLGNYIIIEYE